MELEEIFKTSPELLKEVEVMKLIEYCQSVHKHNRTVLVNYKKFYDNIMDIAFESDTFIIKGKTTNESYKAILDLIENTDI